MRTCKGCGSKEGEVRWVTLQGQNQGLQCHACKIAAQQQVRATPEGRSKNNQASLNWYTTYPSRSCAKYMRRKAAKLKRTPPWLTQEHFKEIEQIYMDAQQVSKDTGVLHHVDHIIPLRGEVVSGLHVPWNLQVLTASQNISKGNRL